MSEFMPIMSPTHYRLVLSRVRDIAPRKLRRTPNWVLAMEMFCTGSTFAWQACVYAEIDPDGFEVRDIWRKAA